MCLIFLSLANERHVYKRNDLVFRKTGMGRYDPNWSKLQGKLHAICDIQQPQPSSKWHLYYA